MSVPIQCVRVFHVLLTQAWSSVTMVNVESSSADWLIRLHRDVQQAVQLANGDQAALGLLLWEVNWACWNLSVSLSVSHPLFLQHFLCLIAFAYVSHFGFRLVRKQKGEKTEQSCLW